MSYPLTYTGNGIIKIMSSSEFNGLAQAVLEHMASNDGPGSIYTANAAGNTLIGTFTDTRYAGNIGEGNVTILSTEYELYQDLQTPSGTEPPLPLVYNTEQVPISLMNTSQLDQMAANILSFCVNEEGPNSYVLNSSAPSDGGTWTSLGELKDIYSGGIDTKKYLFKKLTSGSYNLFRPLKSYDNGILREFSDAEINYISKKVREQIVTTGVGKYLFQSATPSPGTWVAKGSITNTIATESTTEYTSLYTEELLYSKDRTEIYNVTRDENYTGTQPIYYSGLREIYTGPDEIAYISETVVNADYYVTVYNRGIYVEDGRYTGQILNNNYLGSGAYTSDIFFTGPANYTLDIYLDDYDVLYSGPGELDYQLDTLYTTDFTSEYSITVFETFSIDAVYNLQTDVVYSGPSDIEYSSENSMEGTQYVGTAPATYTTTVFEVFVSGSIYTGLQDLIYSGPAEADYNLANLYTGIEPANYLTINFETFNQPIDYTGITTVIYSGPGEIGYTFDPVYTGLSDTALYSITQYSGPNTFSGNIYYAGPTFYSNAYYTGPIVYTNDTTTFYTQSLYYSAEYYTGSGLYTRDFYSGEGVFSSNSYQGFDQFIANIYYAGPTLYSTAYYTGSILYGASQYSGPVVYSSPAFYSRTITYTQLLIYSGPETKNITSNWAGPTAYTSKQYSGLNFGQFGQAYQSADTGYEGLIFNLFLAPWSGIDYTGAKLLFYGTESYGTSGGSGDAIQFNEPQTAAQDIDYTRETLFYTGGLQTFIGGPFYSGLDTYGALQYLRVTFFSDLQINYYQKVTNVYFTGNTPYTGFSQIEYIGDNATYTGDIIYIGANANFAGPPLTATYLAPGGPYTGPTQYLGNLIYTRDNAGLVYSGVAFFGGFTLTYTTLLSPLTYEGNPPVLYTGTSNLAYDRDLRAIYYNMPIGSFTSTSRLYTGTEFAFFNGTLNTPVTSYETMYDNINPYMTEYHTYYAAFFLGPPLASQFYQITLQYVNEDKSAYTGTPGPVYTTFQNIPGFATFTNPDGAAFEGAIIANYTIEPTYLGLFTQFAGLPDISYQLQLFYTGNQFYLGPITDYSGLTLFNEYAGPADGPYIGPDIVYTGPVTIYTIDNIYTGPNLYFTGQISYLGTFTQFAGTPDIIYTLVVNYTNENNLLYDGPDGPGTIITYTGPQPENYVSPLIYYTGLNPAQPDANPYTLQFFTNFGGLLTYTGSYDTYYLGIQPANYENFTSYSGLNLSLPDNNPYTTQEFLAYTGLIYYTGFYDSEYLGFMILDYVAPVNYTALNPAQPDSIPYSTTFFTSYTSPLTYTGSYDSVYTLINTQYYTLTDSYTGLNPALPDQNIYTLLVDVLYTGPIENILYTMEYYTSYYTGDNNEYYATNLYAASPILYDRSYTDALNTLYDIDYTRDIVQYYTNRVYYANDDFQTQYGTPVYYVNDSYAATYVSNTAIYGTTEYNAFSVGFAGITEQDFIGGPNSYFTGLVWSIFYSGLVQYTNNFYSSFLIIAYETNLEGENEYYTNSFISYTGPSTANFTGTSFYTLNLYESLVFSNYGGPGTVYTGADLFTSYAGPAITYTSPVLPTFGYFLGYFDGFLAGIYTGTVNFTTYLGNQYTGIQNTYTGENYTGLAPAFYASLPYNDYYTGPAFFSGSVSVYTDEITQTYEISYATVVYYENIYTLASTAISVYIGIGPNSPGGYTGTTRVYSGYTSGIGYTLGNMVYLNSYYDGFTGPEGSYGGYTQNIYSVGFTNYDTGPSFTTYGNVVDTNYTQTFTNNYTNVFDGETYTQTNEYTEAYTSPIIQDIPVTGVTITLWRRVA